MPRRVTSVDVAAEAGVSQATVARTFSSPELVSPATRAKVEAAAETLGYVPNAIARSLKSQRTNIVGAVVPATGEFWQSVISAFSAQLAARGEQLLLFSFSDADDVDAVLASVAQYRVDGLVLASALIGSGQLVRMERTGLPLVAFNQPAAAGIVPSVSVDNESGMRDLAEHVIGRGARAVQYVGGISSASTDQIRYRGAARALGERGVACPYIAAGGFAYDDGYKAAARIAQADDLPDAVMVAGDELAFGVLDGLESGGIRVPDDLILTGFDGLPQASWAGYDLTTLVQSTDVLVEKAVELTLDRRDSDQTARSDDASAPADIVVPGTIRIGKTTTPTQTPRPVDGGRPLGRASG